MLCSIIIMNLCSMARIKVLILLERYVVVVSKKSQEQTIPYKHRAGQFPFHYTTCIIVFCVLCVERCFELGHCNPVMCFIDYNLLLES